MTYKALKSATADAGSCRVARKFSMTPVGVSRQPVRSRVRFLEHRDTCVQASTAEYYLVCLARRLTPSDHEKPAQPSAPAAVWLCAAARFMLLLEHLHSYRET